MLKRGITVGVGLALLIFLVLWFSMGNPSTPWSSESPRISGNHIPRIPGDSQGNPARLGHKPLSSAKLSSKAAWAPLDEKFHKRDYQWLVINARTSPASGSYAYAIKALSECMGIRKNGSREAQTTALEQSIPRNDPTRESRLRAFRELFEPCQALGDLEQMRAEQIRLDAEIRQAGDVLEVLAAESMRLADRKLPKEPRQRRVAELMALDDGVAFSRLLTPLTARGATFEGVELTSSTDQGAYRTAWALALCANYGVCDGPDSTQGHKDCLLHGECRYLSAWEKTQQMGMPMLGGTMSDFYARIQRNLGERNFGAFGVP